MAGSIASPNKKIIFPLDLPTLDEALGYVRLLKESVGLFKIGLELFVAEGPRSVEVVKKVAPECSVFLDMKFHDIPATVGAAYSSAVGLGAEFVTVHLDDAGGMLQAMKDVKGETKILGVTVLTSLSGENLKAIGFSQEFSDPEKLALKRAAEAKRAGLSGVVCSPLESAAIRAECGSDFIIVNPGIRPVAADDDQKRVATPYEAIKNGADYIVVGRPIRHAPDPVKAATGIAEDIGRALEEVD